MQIAQWNWGVSTRAAILFFSAPLIALAFIVIAHFVSEDFLRQIEDEDGIIEWLQFAGFAIGSALCLLISYHFATRRSNVAAVLYFLLGLALMFVAGEEIAWGQRVLGLETPAELAEINEKREISVHNVSSLSELFNVAKFAVGLYGTTGCWILPSLAKRRDVRSLEFFIVPWFLSSAFLVILLQRILRWTLLRSSVPRGYGEFDESCLAFGAAAFVALVLRRVYWHNSKQPS